MFRSLIIPGLIVGLTIIPGPVQGEPPTQRDGKVHPDVRAALEKSADGRVLVEVTLKPVGEEELMPPERWDLITRLQDGVLARTGPGKFKVTYRPNQEPGMLVGHVSAAGLATLVVDPDVVAVRPGKITSDVYTKLEKSEDGRVFVCITLKADGREQSGTVERRKARIKKVQDETLARMKPGEYEVAWRYETAAMLVGHIDAAGLSKLATVPSVVAVSPSKVEPETYTQLQESNDETVFVGIILKRTGVRGRQPIEELKSGVKEIQERVLSVLEPSEFKIISQFHNITALLDGYINAAGLAKLEAHPDVVRVGGSKSSKVKVGLLESVPFIQADLVHDWLGYTGAGITIALLDTGVDGNNPDVQGDMAPGARHFLRRAGGGTGSGAEDGHGHGTSASLHLNCGV